MNLKNGLYLFPEGENFSVYGVFMLGLIEMGKASAGELLIEFLDFDFSRIFSLIKNTDSFSGEEVYSTINELGKSSATPFLIKLMTESDWMKAFDNDSENWDEEYRASAAKTINSIIWTRRKVWELADYYCERFGSAEDRFDLFHALSEPFTSMTVEEIISARKPGKEFFDIPSENDYCFPYTKAYRFTDIENYSQFVFLNMMQYNYNFCKCNYCYRFFIPKTKKLTRFCDRIDPKSGKPCKEIAPIVYRNDDISSNKILKQYNLTARRNYMRMCRSEERMFGESAEKDLDPETYFEWRDRVVMAMKLWKSKKISDDEFLKIIKQLD